MKIQLIKLWELLRSSYWFVPSQMAIIASGLAFIMLWLDKAGKIGLIEKLGWIYTGGPDGARTLLSTVAGSMITVAATAFSITIVSLTLASSQFGPRLLRNFMQDRGNQIVLGTFIATFIYCLLILRTIRGADYNAFVPQISVTFGVLLAIASIGVLIYFIHHAAASIQADNVIAEVSEALEDAMNRLFPEQIGQANSTQPQGWVAEISGNFDAEASPVKVAGSGYIQAIDDDKLMEIAKSNDLILRLQYRPGNFVVQGNDLVMVYPGKLVNEKLTEKINETFILGSQPTDQQDIEFAINQLVEIAVRALSPGINDPFTAIRCIDQLSVALSHLAQRQLPSPYRYDHDNNLRVIANQVTFAGLTDAAFNQIRQYGCSDVAVTIRLLEAIAVIAISTYYPKQLEALRRQAIMIRRSSAQAITEEWDCKDIEQQYWTTLRAIERSLA